MTTTVKTYPPPKRRAGCHGFHQGKRVLFSPCVLYAIVDQDLDFSVVADTKLEEQTIWLRFNVGRDHPLIRLVQAQQLDPKCSAPIKLLVSGRVIGYDDLKHETKTDAMQFMVIEHAEVEVVP